MSRINDVKREALALIDAMKTIGENAPQWGEMTNFSTSVRANPIEFLLDILSKFVSYEEMVEWLSNFLVDKIPAIELATKTVLLAQLKDSIDCSIDPFIPDKFRKNFEIPQFGAEISKKKGIHINVTSIDKNGILNISPLSESGYNHYFGTSTYYILTEADGTPIEYNSNKEPKKHFTYLTAVRAKEEREEADIVIREEHEIENVYQLTRAEDFNAFMWFGIHKANFAMPIPITGDLKDWQDEFSRNVFQGEKNTILNYCKGQVKLSVLKKARPFIPGNVITQAYGSPLSVLSMCISTDEKLMPLTPIEDDDDTISDAVKNSIVLDEPIVIGYAPRDYYMDFVPISSNFRSINWYADRDRYFNFLHKESSRNFVKRDYGKEFAICNIEYEDEIKESNVSYRMTNNKILFSILPKPAIHIPRLGENPFNVTRLLFDSEGKETSKGKYTVKLANNTPKKVSDNSYAYDIVDTSGRTISEGVTVLKNEKFYFLSIGTKKPQEVLFECYPGLTIYEFDYDLIMSMQFFDATTLASKLIASLTNSLSGGQIGVGLKVNKTETAYQMRIAEIIKNIIESDAYEVADCFYTFSNEKYDKMLNEAEMKRAELYPFQDSENKGSTASIDDILNDLNSCQTTATKEEKITTIKRAINDVTAQITQEVLPEDKYNIKIQFILDMIKSLINLLVDTLFSPKVLLILAVNKKLLEDEDEDLKFEDLLGSIKNVIVALVKSILDMITQAIYHWVEQILLELIDKLKDMILKEQLDYYLRLMRQLITKCMFKFGKRADLDTELDTVDYADIDQIDQPQRAEC